MKSRGTRWHLVPRYRAKIRGTGWHLVLLYRRRKIMNSAEIVRSWKDEDYRLGLSAAEQLVAQGNPAGLVALSDEELSEASGGADPLPNTVILSPATFYWLPPITLPMVCLCPR